ncbi:hypothetical protein [Desertivibrio insolitus]|uniref:hypothetical protein n=1 Tax=Herbiconiux sp. SYSU D00978 TaxID=2812562 RepID=UPI001A962811|nr:hypothetical protein [Herbiconiux sp. SYSU D00978]
MSEDSRTRPPRPEMSDTTPPPVKAPPKAPAAIATTRVLLLVSFVAGFVVIMFAFLSRNTRVEELRTFVTDFDADADSAAIDTTANVLFWATLGVLTAVIVIEALLLQAMMRRHGSGRWVLVFVVALHAAVALFANELLTLGEDGLVIAIALVAQLLLAGAALLSAFMPGSWRWFRKRDDPAAA